MKVTILPIVIGEFGTVTKGLLKGLEDLAVGARVETIQTTTLLRTTDYWEESGRLEETCCHTISSKRPSSNADVKNCNDYIVIIIRSRVKLKKKSEKRDKYIDRVRELRKLWNMKVAVIPIVIAAVGTVSKGFVQRLEDLEIRRQMETIKSTVLLRWTRILKRVLVDSRDLLSFKLQLKSIS